MIRCYNIGCGNTFIPEENKEDSCKYHPQPPIFHDGRKGWDCCKKFSTDFSTCLNTPGCTIGFHNSDKPKEEAKPELDEKFNKEVVIVEPLKPIKTERPSGDIEMIPLSIKILPSLKPALDKKLEELKLENNKIKINDTNHIETGTLCKNKGCKSAFISTESNKEICMFHDGEPIFHEGMKFWTCCNRKTTEFDSFMDQIGCKSGKHVWHMTKAETSRTSCRYDWFQINDVVTLPVYAKLVVPSTVDIRANSVRLIVKFDYDAGLSTFERTFELYEPINVQESHVKLGSAKVELSLKKLDQVAWRYLEIYKGK